MKIISLGIAAWLLSVSLSFAAPTVNDPDLRVRKVVEGLNFPTTMAFIGPDEFLVLEKSTGIVRLVRNGVIQSQALDVAVDPFGEQGLLGIALHPDFPTNNLVYLYFTESSAGGDIEGTAEANRIYSYEWDPVNQALINRQLILALPVTGSHLGGILAFGPDDKLYIAYGDQNRDGQLQNNPSGALPDDTGVIFRLNDDGSSPADNPFAASAGMEKIYAYGVRNSFGMAFDPATGVLWDTENGVEDYDEVNIVRPGFNSGWRPIMGPDSRSMAGVGDLVQFPGSHYADPRFSWVEVVAPTGIAFLRSTQLGSEYRNAVVVGDFNGNISLFKLNGARNGFVLSGALADRVADDLNERNSVSFGTGFNGVTDLKVGPDGLLYVVSFSDGAVYVIEPSQLVILDPSALSQGEVGVPYDVLLNIGGGTAPYVATVSQGALPAGLNIVGNNITGLPVEAKISSFTLQVVDNDGTIISKRFTIRVLRATTIATTALIAGKSNRKYAAALRVLGGKRAFSWSLMLGDMLPAGLTLDAATGRITGTPTLAAVGTTNFTVKVTDALGGTDTQPLSLTIQP